MTPSPLTTIRPRSSRGSRRAFGLLGRLVALLGAAAILVGLLPAAPAAAADGALALSVSITDVNGNPITSVDASNVAAYRVNIGYGCNVADCTGVKVKVAATELDPYYAVHRKESVATYIPPYSPAPAISGNIATGYTIDLGTVTAGTNGVIRLDYTVNAQGGLGRGNFFPDGSPIEPDVTISAGNAVSVSDSATASWVSYIPTPSLTVTTAPASVISTDQQMTVSASSSSGCWRLYNGVLRNWPHYLCGDTGQITVQLPAKAVYVAGSGGTYDAVAHTVTVRSGPKAWQSVNGAFKVTFPSSAYPTSGDGCVVPETFTAKDATYTYLDGTSKVTNPTTAQRTVTVGNCAPFAKAVVGKSSYVSGGHFSSNVWNIPATSAGNYNVYWLVSASNQANVPGVATIVDNDLDQSDLPVTTIQVVAGGPADISYSLDDGTPGTATGVTSLPAPAGRHFASATVTSALLAGPNVKPSDTGGVPLSVRFYSSVKAGATPGPRTNTATATMTYPDYPELGTITATGSPATRTVTLVNPATPYKINASNLGAVVTGGGIPLVGGEVVWTGNGSVTNLVQSTSLTPQYVYLAPPGWDIKPNGASFVSGDPGATFDYRTVTYGGNSHKAVIVTWPQPTTSTGTFTLPQLQVKTTPTGAAPAGTANQTAYFFVGDAGNGLADGYEPTKVTDTTDIDLDGVTSDEFARGAGTTSLAASPAIGLVKEICRPDPGASDGCEWIANSSIRVGVSPDADSIKYRVTIQNKGNAPLSNAVAYDVLPFVGDTGTTTSTAGTPRGSTVQEQLSSVSDVSSGVTLAYSTSQNPPRPEVFTGTTTGDWTAPVAAASAIRVTIPSLPAGQSRSFQYVAALVGGAADQVACNSVAIAATGLVAVEPSPVCATTQEADFSIESPDHLPLQSGRVGVVPFVVNNGGGSQSATGTVTIAVPGEVSVASLTVPGWSCAAPSTDGPVTVTCHPVNGDGSTRSLAKDVPETIQLKVRPTAAAPDELCFDASVAGLMVDPDLDNNTARSCSTALSSKPELLVTKDDNKLAVKVGEQYTYTITASSRLVAESIAGVELTDTLPAGLELVSASPAPTSVAGQTLTWDLGALAQAGIPGGGGDGTSGGPGSSKSVTVTVRVLPGTQDSLTNTADATGADPADPATILAASDEDVDVVTNVFTDLGASETTPHNTAVTTPLVEIASTTGAPLDPTAVTQSGGPAHGTLTINPATGAVRYDPDAGYSGADSYQVQVCDTTSPTPQCHVATVTVQVGVNVVDAVDDPETTDAAAPVTTGVRGNDTTTSGQPLAVPTIVSPPSDGTVAVNGNGTITYTPDAGTSGVDSYTYQVCDTSHPTPVCDTATVTITVRNVYVDSGIALTTPQNTAITAPLADIVATVGAPIDPSSVTEETAPQHGSLSINPTTGAVTYTPDPGYSGPDSYELAMCDDNGSDCHQVTVPVTVQPNAVGAVDDSTSTDSGAPVTTNVRGNDTSASGQSLASPTVQSGPAHGSTLVNADGTIAYTPAAGFSGTDSYTYRVCDTSHPTPVCDTASVTVLVRNVFTDLGATETTPHNTAVTTPLGDIVSATGAAVDPTAVSQDTAPQHGTISVDPATGAVTYTPAAGYAGPDSYDVRVCDTSTPTPQCFTATVEITVTPNVVVAVDDADTTDAVTPVSSDVRDNDTTQSGEPLAQPTVTVDPGHGTTVVNAGGTITYTPAAGFSGTDSYTYQVCDTSHPTPVCDTAVVTVTVENVWTDRDAAVVTPHNTAATTALAAVASTTGAPLDPASVTEETAPTHGTIAIDPATGAITYTPATGYAGPDSYTVTVCDTSTPTPECRDFTVPVTVKPNVVTAVDDAATTDAGVAVTSTVRGNDTTASGQPLGVPTITSAPTHGTTTVNADGTVTYIPAVGFSGADSYTYRVCDTSHPTPVCDTATVTVQVDSAKFDLTLTNRLTSAAHVMVGDKVRYRLQVSNRGPDPVTGVIVLKDALPKGLELVSARGPGWDCKVDKASDKVTCTWTHGVGEKAAGASLAAGQKSSPVIVVGKATKRAVGVIVNVAKVQASGDVAVANNRARASVTVAAVPGLPHTGFRITAPTLSLRW